MIKLQKRLKCHFAFPYRFNMEQIEFSAQIAKVQTLIDGGLRVTLDLSEQDVLAAAHLMECKRQGVYGRVSFVPIVTECSDETGKNAEGSTPDLDSGRITLRRNKRKSG